MIMFWNRREVLVSFSMQKFNEVRNILDANKIKYLYRIFNPQTSTTFGLQKNRWGSSGERADLSNQYYIYVHESDYEQANFLINTNINL